MESTDRTHGSGRNPLWQRIHELSLLEPEEHQQFEHLYLWFLSQGTLSVHALRYCTVCVQVLGSLNVRDIAAAIWQPPSSGGSVNARVVDLFKFTVVDETRVLHSLFGVLGEADHRSVSLASRQVSADHRLSRASSVEAPLSHRGSSAGGISSVELPLSREASGTSAHISLYPSPRELSGGLDEVLLSSAISAADLILATVASPLTIQTRLAYLFAFPAHRHCFSTTLLQRHRVGSLHDEHQGQGLTGLLLAPHCGKRFYTHDVGLFQHLPRLRAATATATAVRQSPPQPQPAPASSTTARQRYSYHPYYQAYDFDFAEPSLVRAATSSPATASATEAQSLPPDARCIASDAEAWRLLSPSDAGSRDVGLAGLLSHIQLQHQQQQQHGGVAAGVCFNEVGAIVRRPEDILAGLNAATDDAYVVDGSTYGAGTTVGAVAASVAWCDTLSRLACGSEADECGAPVAAVVVRGAMGTDAAA
eukprot:gene9514-6817_t